MNKAWIGNECVWEMEEMVLGIDVRRVESAWWVRERTELKEERFEIWAKIEVFILEANKHLDSPVEDGLDLFWEGAESLARRRDRCGGFERSKNIHLCWDCVRADAEHSHQG
jgi:hypothetical protein